MADTKPTVDENDLGFTGPYEQFLEQEKVPVIKGFFIKDVQTVELAPWERKGGLGVYINLDGAEGINDAYVCEIPGGGALKPQKHLIEELIFVVSGQGATTVWRDNGRKHTFEWQQGSLFSPPLNTWHQHFNGRGDKPARILSVTDAPLVINLFHNLDFIFNCDYAFRDRYNEEAEYFSERGKALAKLFWETNFVRDVRTFELVERKWRVAGERMRHLEIANNVMSAHISEFPVGTYKKAHRHGPGSHVIVLQGEGYSVMWPENAEIQRYDWQEGSLFVPPERWFHQHFNTGTVPARYLALKPFTSRKYPGLKKRFGITEALAGDQDQIEFENEDPRISEMFQAELAKKGVRIRMTDSPVQEGVK